MNQCRPQDLTIIVDPFQLRPQLPSSNSKNAVVRPLTLIKIIGHSTSGSPESERRQTPGDCGSAKLEPQDDEYVQKPQDVLNGTKYGTGHGESEQESGVSAWDNKG